MAAVVGCEWRHQTLRELFVRWQAVMMDRWHHTAHLMMVQIASKKVRYHDLHPYIAKDSGVPGRMRIDPTNHLRDIYDELGASI